MKCLLRSSLRAVLGFAVAAAPSAVALAAPPQCIQLEGQSYCQVWSHATAAANTTEYLRRGETVNHWQNMITIVRYNNASTLKAVIPAYLATVRPYLGPDANPQWVAPKKKIHAEEAATRLILSDSSESEYVVDYFFSDPGKHAYAIVFSQHIPLPSGQVPTKAQYGGWLTDMQHASQKF